MTTQRASQYTPDLFGHMPQHRGTATAESFYNTTRLRGSQLAKCQNQALSQERIIEDFFAIRPGRLFTPAQLAPLLPHAPLTSVRRAVTNLTRAGVLEKTTRQRDGVYGRPEHFWRLSATYSRN